MRYLFRAMALGSLAVPTKAVTPVSDAEMTTLLSCGSVSLAMKAQPMFLMGQMLGYQPCIPTFATVDGKQATPSELCSWPNSGCDCRNPGVPVGNPLPSFPVYYSFSKCSDTSIRIAYNLFYTKDGFSPNKIFGHPLDWERAVVVWNKTDTAQWTPAQLFLSQHTGYQRINWDQIESTFTTEDANKPRGGCDDQKNLDHPKVYIASAKHDIHMDKNTGWIDVFSQLTDNAYRSDDWWYFPKKEDYILADGSTDIGKLIASFDWGDADSTPPSVAEGLCAA
ncbi:hypothetical protein QQS21_007960 [Conoideocrella luteorostrata]|uniref:Uncharacterized protein n=1 Tax=Conoideocrella luteorostrata TaxID=1105319 RepID=A0AAJ0FZ18_9HYPO|nr:hypothetical protein QQS21_007960 [Conoideocrella luteorostrata]